MSNKKQIVHFKIVTHQELDDFCTPRSMERGEKLYRQRAVINPTITENGVESIVYGSMKYKCLIEWDTSAKEWDFSCTCPYDHGGICKHLVALGLWMIDNCLYETARKIEKSISEIDDLLNQADISVLREFVKNTISADEIYLEKFKTLLYDLETSFEDVSIDDLMKKYLELFSSLEISDEEDAIDSIHWRNNDYYQEDWELIEEVQLREIEEHLEGAFDDISESIETGKLLQAVYHYFAFIEAYGEIDEMEIDLDYDVPELIDRVIKDQQDSIYKLLKKQSFRTETMDMIIKTFSDRYLKGESAKFYLIIFENFMLCLPYDTEQAERLLKSIREKSVTIADKLQMKLVKATKNRTKKTKICQDLVPVNLEAAKFLLNKFKDDPVKYHDIVQRSIPKFSRELLPDTFPNLQKDINPDLYINAAEILFQLTKEIKYYRIYKNLTPNFQLENYLMQLKDSQEKPFNILIEEKQFDRAFDFYVNKMSYGYYNDQYLLLLINHLPQTCFDYIIKETSEKLAISGKREIYQKAGRLLAVLLRFKDEILKKKGRQHIDNLCQKYRNRPAMLDEFRSLKLI